MKAVQTKGIHSFFRVVAGSPRSQGATMILRPGQRTGGDDNIHRDADQWLYVVSGSGVAMVNGRRVDLEAGTLLLIEAGEAHEIINEGTEPLATVNVYAPPAY